LAEWLIEYGIGEHRALLMDGAQVCAAKVYWPGEMNAGRLVTAKLASKLAGKRRGIAVTESGTEILLDNLPPAITEGASLYVTITRAPITERGRLKRAIGRAEDTRAVEEGLARCVKPAKDVGFGYPMLGEANVRQLPPGSLLDDRWDEVWHAASAGEIDFAGGSILVSVTPAMTVIDIDGTGRPRDLALAAIPAIGQALRWFDIGGNIGIDFPTIQDKADRKAVDAALDAELTDWPHERTAMNGFGFVQLVARLEGPSLLHRFATSRTGMCARHALRVAEAAQGHGPVLELRVHAALKPKLKPEWLAELARRTGREVRIATDPGLALEAPSAQIVAA
jgi:ribonuclease G